MQIIHNLTMELTRREEPLMLDAVQDDGNTRQMVLTLLEDGQPWEVPAGVTAAVAFRKPDKRKGLYDTLPDGTKAVTIDGSTVTAVLAPQVLTCPGETAAAVVFYDSGLNQLATFPFTIRVEKNPAAGQEISNDYYRYSTMEAVSEAVEKAIGSLEAAKADFLAQAEEALAVVHDTATEDAPAIVCENTGEMITVSDSSDRPLKGLTLYGKTIQNGTPTPENPVPLETVGAGGAIHTTVCGKNLCNPNKFSTSYYTVGTDGYITFTNKSGYNQYPECTFNLPKGTYTVSVEVGSDTAELYISNKKGDYTTWRITNSATKTFADTELLWLIVSAKDNTQQKVRITINAGSTPLPYEPYKDQALTASTPNGLPGIPVSSGGSYTDESGQAWICDEIDFARGVYVKRIQTVQMPSTGDTYGLQDDSGYFYTTRFASDGNKVLCNRATCKGVWELSGGITIIASLNRVVFAKSWFGVSTREEFAEYLKNNPTFIMYAMATPIETALSAEELASYAALHTNKPNTTVYNDGGAGMKLEYVADTKTYIDNKITAISKAMIG